MTRIVTISGQTGAYGNLIADIVAKRLGLEIISREKIHELALSCHPEHSNACETYELEHILHPVERVIVNRPYYRSVFESLAYEAASQGNVIIIGRGANIALRHFRGVSRFRIVAPTVVRIQRIMKRQRFSKEQADQYVRRYDDEQRNLIHTVFDRDIDDGRLYDVILNTVQFTAEAAADVVIQAIEQTEKVADRSEGLERLNDLAFAKRVETLIRRRLTSVVAGHVEVTPGPEETVILTGRIRDQKDKLKAQEIAMEYPGVTKVENELEVTDLLFDF